jgi:hypothetical protein
MKKILAKVPLFVKANATCLAAAGAVALVVATLTVLQKTLDLVGKAQTLAEKIKAKLAKSAAEV